MPPLHSEGHTKSVCVDAFPVRNRTKFVNTWAAHKKDASRGTEEQEKRKRERKGTQLDEQKKVEAEMQFNIRAVIGYRPQSWSLQMQFE